MKNTLNNLFLMPHKSFILGGVICSIIFMLIMAGQYLGLFYLGVDSTFYHVYSIIFTVFTQFFTGFLFTTFPRFLSTKPVDKSEYQKIFYILNISAIFFAISLFFDKGLQIVPMVGIFVANIMIYKVLKKLNKNSFVTNKYDTNRVVAAFEFGLISHGLFLFAFISNNLFLSSNFAINIGFFLYMFMIFLILSAKMIPFFTQKVVQNYKINKSKNFLEIVFVLLAFKVTSLSFGLEKYTFFIDLLLFLVTARELLKWKLPLFKTPAMMWVLYLALFWMPIGFLFYFIDGLNQFILDNDAFIFEKTPIHILAIGYFLTMFVGFGTRIVLGHSGRVPKADSFTVKLFLLIQVLVVFRVIGGFLLGSDIDNYFYMIAISSIFWITLFILWLKKYLKIILE